LRWASSTSADANTSLRCALLDAEPSWTIVGWKCDEQLVAAAGVERTSDDELTIHAIGARDEPDARALLEAIAGVATGSRLVAETPGTGFPPGSRSI
jgi:hypothetical protein